MYKYHGKLATAELCKPIEDTEIRLYNFESFLVETIYSNNKGEWTCSIPDEIKRIVFNKAGFVAKEIIFDKVTEILNPTRLLEDKLIGYQDKLWFTPGEHINTYVHSPETFTARLYRHGFFKSLVIDIGCYQSVKQTVPDGYFVDKGLNWDVTFSYTIPEDATPGLYSLLLESASQGRFAIPFIVSTPYHEDTETSKILVLASTNTWQSYNVWGGRSRYRNFEVDNETEFKNIHKRDIRSIFKKVGSKLIPPPLKVFLKSKIFKQNPDKDWVYNKLTIKRPFTNCALEDEFVFKPFTNHLAAGEWRVLAWLEREQIPYDIIAGYELHHNPKMLNNYRAMILSTHCEYWSQKMYNHLVKHHENKGLWIINISGNSLYREIDFYENGSTRCTSLSFQESCADETQILGVRFNMDDYATCAPFKILQPDHWVFNSIPGNVRYFGGLSLNQNTQPTGNRYDPGRPGSGQAGLEYGLDGMGGSGWETDKISKTAPNDIKIIAKGCNKKGGADMVIREPKENRGGMFSASSLVFGGCLLIDDIASQILKNVINRALSGV